MNEKLNDYIQQWMAQHPAVPTIPVEGRRARYEAVNVPLLPPPLPRSRPVPACVTSTASVRGTGILYHSDMTHHRRRPSRLELVADAARHVEAFLDLTHECDGGRIATEFLDTARSSGCCPSGQGGATAVDSTDDDTSPAADSFIPGRLEDRNKDLSPAHRLHGDFGRYLTAPAIAHPLAPSANVARLMQLDLAQRHGGAGIGDDGHPLSYPHWGSVGQRPELAAYHQSPELFRARQLDADCLESRFPSECERPGRIERTWEHLLATGLPQCCTLRCFRLVDSDIPEALMTGQTDERSGVSHYSLSTGQEVLLKGTRPPQPPSMPFTLLPIRTALLRLVHTDDHIDSVDGFDYQLEMQRVMANDPASTASKQGAVVPRSVPHPAMLPQPYSVTPMQDVYWSAGSYRAARLAAAGVVHLVLEVCKPDNEAELAIDASASSTGQRPAGAVDDDVSRAAISHLSSDRSLQHLRTISNGFCLVRPPGHHCCGTKAAGFCIFNNIAVAARVAQHAFPGRIRRVLIVDWDVHHGDGTEAIFQDDSSVLVFSVHQYGGKLGHIVRRRQASRRRRSHIAMQVLGVPAVAGTSYDTGALRHSKAIRKTANRYCPPEQLVGACREGPLSHEAMKNPFLRDIAEDPNTIAAPPPPGVSLVPPHGAEGSTEAGLAAPALRDYHASAAMALLARTLREDTELRTLIMNALEARLSGEGRASSTTAGRKRPRDASANELMDALIAAHDDNDADIRPTPTISDPIQSAKFSCQEVPGRQDKKDEAAADTKGATSMPSSSAELMALGNRRPHRRLIMNNDAVPNDCNAPDEKKDVKLDEPKTIEVFTTEQLLSLGPRRRKVASATKTEDDKDADDLLESYFLKEEKKCEKRQSQNRAGETLLARAKRFGALLNVGDAESSSSSSSSSQERASGSSKADLYQNQNGKVILKDAPSPKGAASFENKCYINPYTYSAMSLYGDGQRDDKMPKQLEFKGDETPCSSAASAVLDSWTDAATSSQWTDTDSLSTDTAPGRDQGEGPTGRPKKRPPWAPPRRKAQPSFYPYTGSLDVVGGGAPSGRHFQGAEFDADANPAAGRHVNVPWPTHGFGDLEYYQLFTQLLVPMIKEFQPDLILVSSGFDSARNDILGSMSLTPSGYYWLTRVLHETFYPDRSFDPGSSPYHPSNLNRESTSASSVAPSPTGPSRSLRPPRLVVTLEGGYNLTNVALCTESVLRALMHCSDDIITLQQMEAQQRRRRRARFRSQFRAVIGCREGPHGNDEALTNEEAPPRTSTVRSSAGPYNRNDPNGTAPEHVATRDDAAALELETLRRSLNKGGRLRKDEALLALPHVARDRTLVRQVTDLISKVQRAHRPFWAHLKSQDKID